MKKKLLNSMRMLLVAAGLLVGANAWADKTYLNTMTGLVGETDLSGAWWTNCSKPITIADGESYVLTFLNRNTPTADYSHANWYLEITDGVQVFDAQVDGGAAPWGGDLFTSNSQTGVYSSSFSSATEWNTAYNGAVVTLTVSRTGSVISASHTATCTDASNTVFSGTISTTYTGSNDLSFYIVAAGGAYQVITNVQYTDAESNVTNYTPVYEHGFTTGWTSSDVTKTENTKGLWYCSNGISTAEGNSGMRINATYGLENHARGNSTNTATLTLGKSLDIVTIDAIWNVGNTNGTPRYEGYNQFRYGDFYVTYYPRNKETSYTINGKKTTVTSVEANTALTIHIKVNSVSGNISEFYIKNGSTILAQYSNLTSSNNTFASGADYDKVITTAYHNASSVSVNNYLTSLLVTEEASAATYSNVTFTYATTDGTSLSTIKSNIVVEDVEDGTAIASLIADSYKTTFYSDDTNIRYTYNTYSVPGDVTEVSGDITVTLKFTAAEKFNYTVDAVDAEDGIIKAGIVSGSCYADETASFYIPSCVLADGKLYFTTAEASYKSETVSSNNQVFPYAYTESTVDNVVFFVEGEEISGAATSTPTSNQRLASKGHMGRGSNLNVTTLPAGTYTVYVKYINTNASAHTLIVKAGDTDIINATDVTVRPTKEGTITLTETTAITLTAAASSTSGVDYLYIVKTGDVVNFTLGAESGDSYKSFVTTGNTDFAGKGITAYIAKAADAVSGKVTLSTIENAPANTPVLLKSTKGSNVTIATTTSSYSAPAVNLLKAADGSTAIGATDAKYVLAYTDSKWQFRHYNGTLSAGKVYLDLTSLDARPASLTFDFEDNETTGINNVNVNHNDNWYDLQGRRVAAPQKGLYIVNGKKVVIK